jgi:hypothetical protein
MATATRSRANRNGKADKTAPADAPETVNVSAAAPTDPAPTAPADPAPTDPGPAPAPADTLQSALDRAPAPAQRTETVETGDNAAGVFNALVGQLAALVSKGSALILFMFIQRGRVVRDALNVKLRLSRNAVTRKANRAAAFDAMQLTALTSYDPAAESKPDVEKWYRLAILADHYPNAAGLPSVKVALAFAETLTRIDPPKTFDAPEEWEAKREYPAGAVSLMIDTAIAECWSEATAREAIERLAGRVEIDAPAAKVDDPIKSARALAGRVMESITARKIDPETFFDALQSELSRYGWHLVKSHRADGTETFKPIQTGRSQTVGR